MKWTKELLRPIILNIIRSDLAHEANRIIDTCTDVDFESFIEYADKYLNSTKKEDNRRFDNIACLELDMLKSKLEYFGRLKKCESAIGFDMEIMPELIAKWRQEKLNTLINNKQ